MSDLLEHCLGVANGSLNNLRLIMFTTTIIVLGLLCLRNFQGLKILAFTMIVQGQLYAFENF